jgi:putative oxidoreductase
MGAVFLWHGWDKIDYVHGNWGTDWAREMWANHPGAGAVPAPLTFPWVQFVVAWGEFLGGAALVLGLFTRLAAVGMILIQGGAIYMVTAAHGFTGKEVGWEYNFVLLAGCLAMFITGGGICAMDHLFRASEKKPEASPASLQPV